MSAQTKPGGPIIGLLQLDESSTLGEAIEIVRKASLKNDASFALKVDLTPAELQAKLRGRMTLRNVPAMVALQYICDDSIDCTLSYNGGLWKIDNSVGEYPSEVLQISILDITEDELSAIGIREKGKRSFMTTAGKKWPSGEGEGEFAALAEDTLIVRARRSEIENLRALLKLHRAGYKIPKIGSNQADKK